MNKLLFCAVAGAALAGASAGCDAGFPAGREPHHEFNFLDMADQPKMKPQRAAPRRVEPPVGAVAVDYYPYPYAANQAALASRQLQNPIERTPASVAHGKWVFENVCVVCHGAQGAGDGEVSKLFPKPPSLMTQKVRDWTDGRIFHVPMRGQGSMPNYSKQLEQDEIWSVVHYLRDLQSKQPVAPPDPTASSSEAMEGTVAAEGAGGAAGAGGTDGAGGTGGAGGAAGTAGAGGAADAGSGGALPADGDAAEDRPTEEPAEPTPPTKTAEPKPPPPPAEPAKPAKPAQPAAPEEQPYD
ncbi:MAG: cytochrome c [Deltaproteobacteria bacterium]|jgi:mono/diheme cytochrome c family protein|nr:cytochrome c [Deltaproteobacteria bacterium]MBW2536329.1 cytochrome c [Deltaproteobacteria bacterium]